ncbi:hypothetical protein LTR10_004415 [Elasticomyces elasticus]|nr:hypothetical protein LTR10_004415 [Elasticomyces elasticus]KAK4976732.1 hypothetical protein LTR42_002777 [Elasticomyces elasticus]
MFSRFFSSLWAAVNDFASHIETSNDGEEEPTLPGSWSTEQNVACIPSTSQSGNARAVAITTPKIRYTASEKQPLTSLEDSIPTSPHSAHASPLAKISLSHRQSKENSSRTATISPSPNPVSATAVDLDITTLAISGTETPPVNLTADILPGISRFARAHAPSFVVTAALGRSWRYDKVATSRGMRWFAPEGRVGEAMVENLYDLATKRDSSHIQRDITKVAPRTGAIDLLKRQRNQRNAFERQFHPEIVQEVDQDVYGLVHPDFIAQLTVLSLQLECFHLKDALRPDSRTTLEQAALRVEQTLTQKQPDIGASPALPQAQEASVLPLVAILEGIASGEKVTSTTKKVVVRSRGRMIFGFGSSGYKKVTFSPKQSTATKAQVIHHSSANERPGVEDTIIVDAAPATHDPQLGVEDTAIPEQAQNDDEEMVETTTGEEIKVEADEVPHGDPAMPEQAQNDDEQMVEATTGEEIQAEAGGIPHGDVEMNQEEEEITLEDAAIIMDVEHDDSDDDIPDAEESTEEDGSEMDVEGDSPVPDEVMEDDTAAVGVNEDLTAQNEQPAAITNDEEMPDQTQGLNTNVQELVAPAEANGNGKGGPIIAGNDVQQTTSDGGADSTGREEKAKEIVSLAQTPDLTTQGGDSPPVNDSDDDLILEDVPGIKDLAAGQNAPGIVLSNEQAHNDDSPAKEAQGRKRGRQDLDEAGSPERTDSVHENVASTASISTDQKTTLATHSTENVHEKEHPPRERERQAEGPVASTKLSGTPVKMMVSAPPKTIPDGGADAPREHKRHQRPTERDLGTETLPHVLQDVQVPLLPVPLREPPAPAQVEYPQWTPKWTRLRQSLGKKLYPSKTYKPLAELEHYEMRNTVQEWMTLSSEYLAWLALQHSYVTEDFDFMESADWVSIEQEAGIITQRCRQLLRFATHRRGFWNTALVSKRLSKLVCEQVRLMSSSLEPFCQIRNFEKYNYINKMEKAVSELDDMTEGLDEEEEEEDGGEEED